MKPQEYKTNSAKFLVYDKYIVAEPLVYVDVYKNEVEQLHNVVSKYFEGDFGLIENRINESSINPLAYEYAKDLMPNFSAFALVAYSDLAKKSFEVEGLFIENIKYAMFDSLPDAQEWIESVL